MNRLLSTVISVIFAGPSRIGVLKPESGPGLRTRRGRPMSDRVPVCERSNPRVRLVAAALITLLVGMSGDWAHADHAAPLLLYKAKSESGARLSRTPIELRGDFGSPSAEDDFKFRVVPRRLTGVGLMRSAGTDAQARVFTQYRIRAEALGIAEGRPLQVVTEDACGSLSLELDPPDSLLLSGDVGLVDRDPGAGSGERFACFSVRDRVKPSAGAQQAIAGFDSERLLDLKKPRRICLPISLGGVGEKRAPASGANSLVCYQAKLAAKKIEQGRCGPMVPGDRGEKLPTRQARHRKQAGVAYADALGSGTFSTRRESEVCFEARTGLPPIEDTGREQIYVTTTQMTPLLTEGELLFLRDGNVNGAYTNPTVEDGYLDGPELALFDWGQNPSSTDCAPGVDMCEGIATSSEHRSDRGLTRPHWGASTEDQYLGTLYFTLRDAIRNYFDRFNSVDLDIADVDNEHELVVMTNRPESVGCSGSCMRPHTDSDARFRIFRGKRPDGRDGGAPYYDRPKIFIRPARGDAPVAYQTTRVPVHEFGHYYTRVFALEYGTGGFNRRDPASEVRALDEGLGYWWSSDYVGYPDIARESETGNRPKYTDLKDHADVHNTGNVISYALWGVRTDSGCDSEGVSRAVFALVDSTPGNAFGSSDPFGGNSHLRGFSWDFLQEARASGACSRAQANAAATIMMDRELIPAWLSQADTGATNEVDDRFGSALAIGDFDGDGYGDLAIGSPGEDGGAIDSGLVHIVYGSAAGIASGGFSRIERINQADLGSSLEAGDEFGAALAAGDFDGDGYSDLAVGSPDEDHSSRTDAGFLFVFYGSAEGLRPARGEKIDQAVLGSTNENGDRFAATLASGDFDADGFTDLAVGSPGETLDGNPDAGFVFMLRGSSVGLLPANYQAFGQEQLGSVSEAGDEFGHSFAVGDFNGDAFDDLAIGAPGEGEVGLNDSGFVWVTYGGTTGLAVASAQRINQASGGSTRENGDEFGYALAAGDFDGDGLDDLAIGSPGETLSAAADSGYLMRFYGSAGGLDFSSVAKGSQATGGGSNEVGDRFAETLAAGDLDGDGYDELIAAVVREDVEAAIDAGAIVIYPGGAARGLPSSVTRVNLPSFDAANSPFAIFGNALVAGDTDGDDEDELFSGAPGQTADGALSAGAVYLHPDPTRCDDGCGLP